MKAKISQLILIVMCIMFVLLFTTCSDADELPPMPSESANIDYPLPKSPMLTEEEREIVYERMNEYEDATE